MNFHIEQPTKGEDKEIKVMQLEVNPSKHSEIETLARLIAGFAVEKPTKERAYVY